MSDNLMSLSFILALDPFIVIFPKFSLKEFNFLVKYFKVQLLIFDIYLKALSYLINIEL